MRMQEHQLRASNAVTGQFATTRWSVVLEAGKGNSSEAAVALENLCRTYWYPLYAFIRRKGFGVEDAKDLTQQFFALLLMRSDFGTVDPHKGKFRTFLLTALTHFLSNEWDRAHAAKRGGGQIAIPLDELRPEQLYTIESGSDLSADRLFDLRWATTVLQQALARLREEMAASGKAGQFDELKRFLTDDAAAGEYDAVGKRLGSNSKTVAVAVHRLRQRYRDLVRAEVANTVSSPLEIEEEMQHLLAVLSR